MESERKDRAGSVSKSTRFRLVVENKWADARRDNRTCLARSNSQARMRTGGISISCSADNEQDWQPYWLMPNLVERDGHAQIIMDTSTSRA